MANAALNIELGLQAEALIAASRVVEARLKVIGDELAKLDPKSKSVAKLSREFNSLNKELQKNQKLQANLGQNIVPDIQKPTKKLVDSSKNARTALTSLSLVAQDLPFGFIGIQNNLPGVVQGFSNLTSGANGLKGGLSELVSALKGPAGLFLAFSIVTSAITFAVQKYGSLGAAIDALLGRQTKLNERVRATAKSLSDYNKELRTNADIQGTAFASQAGNIQRVEELSKIVQDLSLSEQQRGNALKELQKIDKDYFGNISIAAGDVDKLRKATDLYTDSLIRQATIKAFEEQITDIQKQINQQNNLRDELQQQLKVAEKQEKQNKLVRDQAAKLGGQVAGIEDPTIKVNAALAEQAIVIEDLYKARERFNDGLRETIRLQTQAFKPEFEKPEKVKKEFGQIISEGLVEGPGVISFTDRSLKAWLKYNITVQRNAIDRILRDRNSYRKEEIQKTVFGPKKIARSDRDVGIIMPENLVKQIGEIKLILSNLEDVKNILTQTFFQPLESAFTNLFETGKFGFKAFADVVLKQVKQLVARIIATGIISLIANLATGGAASGIAGAGFLKRVGADIFNALGIGAGRLAAPSFAGVGGGELGFGGSVSLTLRGSDLVGALNRTNTTISRVG